MDILSLGKQNSAVPFERHSSAYGFAKISYPKIKWQ
jgi:hypothetical protein